MVGILICVLAVIFAAALVYIEIEIRSIKTLLEGISQMLPVYEIEVVDEDEEISPNDDAELRRKLLN